jgi:hypothetical protein
MDIRFFSRRHHEPAAQSSNAGVAADANQAAQTAAAAQPTAAASSPAAAAPVAAESGDRPAAVSRFSPAGRLVHVLQSFENRHPEETKQVLSNIADKLRSDAERAGPWSDRLNKWADRFQAAAESGDMSKLMPRVSSHFGVRAYQQAEQPDTDATVEHVAGTAESQSGVVRPAAESGTEPATQPATVPESAKVESGSDIRNRPVTVPDSATAETASAAQKASSDIRNRPVTVPESSRVSETQ